MRYALHTTILSSILAISPTAYALPVTNGSNGLKITSTAPSSAAIGCSTHRQPDDPTRPFVFQHIRHCDDPFARPVVLTVMSDNYVLDILLSEDDNYMGTGFTKKQWNSLQELFKTSPAAPPIAPLAAPPQAPPSAPPAQPAQPEPSAPLPAPKLPPLPPTNPPAPQPISAPVSYPPSPSIETIEEVEYKQVYKPLRNTRKQLIGQKHRASKTVPKTRVSKFFENCIGCPAKLGATNMRFSRDENPDAWYTTMLNHRQKLFEASPYQA